MKVFLIKYHDMDDDICCAGVVDSKEKAEYLTKDTERYYEEYEINAVMNQGDPVCSVEFKKVDTHFELNKCTRVFGHKEEICEYLGFIVVVKADSKEQAIEIAKQRLKERLKESGKTVI